MKTSYRNLLFLVIFTSILNITYAEKGDTIEQALLQYGDPVGEAGSKKVKINIYDTPQAKITEYYNTDGICIKSIKEFKPTNRTQYIPRTTPIQKPSPAQKYRITPTQKLQVYPTNISSKERATRPDLQTIIPSKSTPKTLKNEKTKYFSTLKNTIPFAIILTFGTIIIGSAIAIMKTKKTTQNEPTTSDQINAFCDFTQKQYEKKR